MATHNLTKWTRQILRRHSKENRKPSLTLHLYASHFRFEQQNGVFLFDSPMKCFLEYVREQRLPSDLLAILDKAKVPFFEGCLIVQVHDHRAAPSAKMKPVGYTPTHAQVPTPTRASSNASSKEAQDGAAPEVYRIVLGPSTETLWNDLAQLATLDNVTAGPERFLTTTEQVLDFEAKVLQLTQPNLCLDPSFEVTTMANVMLRATTLECPEAGQGDSVAGKRAQDASANSEQEEDKRLKEEFMRMMDETNGRPFAPTFTRMNFVQTLKAERAKQEESKPKDAKLPATGVHPSHAMAAQSHVQQQAAIAAQAQSAQSNSNRAQHPLAQSHMASSSATTPLSISVPTKPTSKRSIDDVDSPSGSVSGTNKKKIGRPTKFGKGANDAASPPPDNSKAKIKSARQAKIKKDKQASIDVIQIPTQSSATSGFQGQGQTPGGATASPASPTFNHNIGNDSFENGIPSQQQQQQQQPLMPPMPNQQMMFTPMMQNQILPSHALQQQLVNQLQQAAPGALGMQRPMNLGTQAQPMPMMNVNYQAIQQALGGAPHASFPPPQHQLNMANLQHLQNHPGLINQMQSLPPHLQQQLFQSAQAQSQAILAAQQAGMNKNWQQPQPPGYPRQ